MRPDIEDRSEHLLPNDRRGWAFLNYPAAVQNHQALRVLRCLVQVMEHHENRQPLFPV